MVCKRSKEILLVLVLIMIFVLFSKDVTAKNDQNSMVYEGLDYTVEITYDQAAGISEDAVLSVNEFYEGSKEFQQYYSKTDEFISLQGDIQILEASFFDVSILDDGKEIEPEKAVKVTIDYKNGIVKEKEDDLKVIHFVEDGSKEFLDVTEEEKKGNLVTEITFEQESFSVIGMITFDGIDSEIKSANSEVISETDNISVKKTWSDGNENHETDSITVSLLEMLSTGKWKICDEMILDNGNEWQGKFKNLDTSKSYSVKETKVMSGDQDKTAIYKSEITNEVVKKWCLVPENQMRDGRHVLLIFEDAPKRVLRKSSNYFELNLRTTNITIVKDDSFGQCCTTKLKNNNIWKCVWNEDSEDWSLYNVDGGSYLTLLYDEELSKYLWTTTREMSEGSHLDYVDGMISSTVDNVTKYMGKISGNGPHEGVDAGSDDVAKFQLFAYKNTEPVKCNILNTKNETVIQQEIQAGVITSKKIDYLGDGIDNPDTDVEERVSDKVLKDLYRLNLRMKMQTDQTGLDLLMVIDVSSSMRERSDSKDENGNAIQRSEALQRALNQFIPSFLDENDRNRVAVVAFEQDSIILQKWTDNSQEILDKINYEVDGEKPLYAGKGTNYESALVRANEALTMRGYSENATAMIFLSDGDPTVCLRGNDDIEKGNVTVSLGEAELAEDGIINTLPDGIEILWVEDTEYAEPTADEAIASFRRHYPEMMIGTIAFNTKVKDQLKNLATDPRYVIQIQNGTPQNLIDTMELITEYRPSEIMMTDELSENVELYKEQPDFRVTRIDENDEETVLYLSDAGLSEEGKKVLNQETPIEVINKKIKVLFQDEYVINNDYVYELSFNVNASQNAFNKYADAGGSYSDKGDEETDYKANDTSSGKEGFYSNGEETKVAYSLNGAEIEKNFRKPVIQVREGTMTVRKTDLDGNRIKDTAVFELLREADSNEENTVELDGYEGIYVKIAEGKTDQNGELKFEHLRLSPFDEGYPYYLVEREAPDGFQGIETAIKVFLTGESAETDGVNNLVKTDGTTVFVKNAEQFEFAFTKVASHDYEKKLSGAEFELYVLTCNQLSHKHEDECWQYLEKQTSNPEVIFKKTLYGNTYKLTEIKAPDGYVGPSGYWIIATDSAKNIEINTDTNLPELKKTEDGKYVLENEQLMNIPVTGGKGTGMILLAGLLLITGGMIMRNKKKFNNVWMFCMAFMVMIQMFGTTVFAIEKTDRGMITVNGVEKDVQVQAYRLMDIIYDYDVQQPKNPVYQWCDGVSAWMISNYPEYIDQTNENAVKKVFSTDEEGKIAELYDKLAVAIKNGDVVLDSKTMVAEGETVLVENLIMGNYFILIEGGAKVYRPLSANVVPEWAENKWKMTNPVVEAKSSEPTITKTVTDGLEKDHMDIGDTISFELNAVVPTYPKNALAKKFIVSDKLSQGLTLIADSIRVYGVNNQTDTLLQNSYVELAERPVEEKNISFALDFNYDVISKYQSIKITYDVLLNENAVVGEAGNSNQVFLDYNNNPYVNTSWNTDEDETTVYTYGMKISKVDETEGTGLAGAEFKLEKDKNEIAFAGDNGNYHVALEGEESTKILKTDEQGKLSISGLDADTYVLTEVKAPAGYIKLQNPIEIQITDEDTDGKPESGTLEVSDGYIPVTVKNDKGFTLPTTGGMGTLMFDITGVLLISAGLICIIRFSRNSKKNR